MTSMSIPLTVLVTGATGRQGSALIRALLPTHAQIHALVRSPDTPAAAALALQGVKLHVGDFSDLASLQRALAHDITAIFLNTSPSSTPNLEINHARNVLLAVTASLRVTHILYPSITLCGQHASFPGWATQPAESFMSTYWRSKHAIEELVRASPVPHTTILRPPTFMSNYLAPAAAAFFPELVSRRTFRTALGPGTRTLLISPEDVGACAAAAFLDPATYGGRVIDVGGEALTPGEIVGALARVSGKALRAEQMDGEEVRRAVEGGNMRIASQLFFNERSSAEVDLEAVRRDFPGVRFQRFEEFLSAREQVVKATFE